eukprot:Gb_19421 [translate_table: standard]
MELTDYGIVEKRAVIIGAEETLSLLKGDFLHYASLSNAMKGCDGVFHLASPITDDWTDNGFHFFNRLLITAVMVASKFVENLNYRNSYYARVGGSRTEEINKLEIEFLFMTGFKLQVTVNVFENYCSHLEREVALGGGFQIERSLQFVSGGDSTSTQEGCRKQRFAQRCGSGRS